jgi:replication factor C subunit 3/5
MKYLNQFEMVDSSMPDEKFWVDKFTPRKFEELDYNHNVSEILKTIAASDDFPHLIFYGPDGAGKKTRMKILLAQIFGQGVFKTTVETKEFKVNTVTVEYLVVSSTYHIEVNPSDNDNHDRHIVQRVIKETASTGSVTQVEKSKKPFKVIILHDIDLLSKDAQAGLRRTMEKYMKSCRLIMSCSSLTKVINPIRSRCLCIRVAAPSVDEIKNSLVKIQLTENVNIDEKVIFAIAENSDRNLRKAINNFQLSILTS